MSPWAIMLLFYWYNITTVTSDIMIGVGILFLLPVVMTLFILEFDGGPNVTKYLMWGIVLIGGGYLIPGKAFVGDTLLMTFRQVPQANVTYAEIIQQIQKDRAGTDKK